MPELPGDAEVDARPPLLNWLIGVTLVTIVASCIYLGNYYLGENPSSKPVWYSLSLFCSPLAGTCSARTGVSASIGMRLERMNNGTLVAYPSTSGMNPSRMVLRATNLDDRGARRREVVSTQGESPLRLDMRTESCSRSRSDWRIELIVTTPVRTMGTWSDMALPCVEGRLVQSD
ncbi:hypothetical protein [Carnimonas nigrificans]|uniref:hypothetical protein n=1 Tax=Carnimonas nigrificans TaxID=64323 RepID=UPI000472130F|nr:hypothetical protein [Carnimonas nigrificans]